MDGLSANRSDTVTSVVADASTVFYDVLFKDSLYENDECNAIEQRILQLLDEKTISSVPLSESIPPFPTCINEILEILQDENADFTSVTNPISKDPVLWAEVLKLANSPYFRTTSRTLDSIDIAVSLLGMTGVNSIVSAVAMKPLLNVSLIYLKLFGQLIWSHSFECAMACRFLAGRYDEDQFLSYLMGLLHDVGRILVFQCMVTALKEFPPEVMPGTLVFRQGITARCKSLSALIAAEWRLPEPLLMALQDQALDKSRKQMSVLGKILYASNRASEVYLLVSRNELADDECRELLVAQGMSEKLVSALFDFLSKNN